MRTRMIGLGFLLLIVLTLGGCGGYPDASVDPPESWALYKVGPLSFKFPAGWSRENTDGLVSQIDANMLTLGGTNDLSILAGYVSPVGEQGTVNYLTIAYYTLEESITAEDLEQIMEPLGEVSKALKTQMALTASLKQNVRIRQYGEYDALTVSYEVGYGETKSVVQTALLPIGKTLFHIAYADFTTVQDDSTLEQLLTSISFDSSY